MKIVLATPLYPPDSGGPATYAKLLKEYLPEQGVDVTLVNFGEVRHLPKVTRHIVYFWRVFKAGRSADVIFALDPVSTGLPALLAARILGKPFVVKIVGDFAWEQGTQRFGVQETLDEFVKRERTPFAVACLRAVQTRVARSATRVIVPSHYLKDIIMTKVWNVSEEKIIVINNAIIEEAKDTLPDDIKKLPAPWIVSVGRMVPWKGFDGLIDAVAIVREKLPGVGLVLVGDGPDRATLENRAQKILKDNFIFAGTRTHQETFSIMAAAAVFVLNSTYEGLSHVLVEATLCGKAIVVTDAGGNSEVITDQENGLLIAPERPDKLAEALMRLLTDDNLREKLGRNAQESSKRFSVPVMIQETQHVLESVVSRN